MSKIIEVIVSPVGNTKIETKGFVGSSCRSASRSLEVALGHAESERLTADFYLNEQTPEANRLQQ